MFDTKEPDTGYLLLNTKKDYDKISLVNSFASPDWIFDHRIIWKKIIERIG